MSLPPLLRLPTEVRTKIYRYLLISTLSFDHRTLLWRSVGVDAAVYRIGYFPRDAVIPLLLTNRQIHAEAASVLYGENTFVFHLSGLCAEPLGFFARLPARYVVLLRKVYVRTGHFCLGPADRNRGGNGPRRREDDPEAVKKNLFLLRRDVAISTELMERAWPKNFRVSVDSKSVLHDRGLYDLQDVRDLWCLESEVRFSASSWHCWKMTSSDLDSANPRMEFRRIVWDTPNLLQQSDIPSV